MSELRRVGRGHRQRRTARGLAALLCGLALAACGGSAGSPAPAATPAGSGALPAASASATRTTASGASIAPASPHLSPGPANPAGSCGSAAAPAAPSPAAVADSFLPTGSMSAARLGHTATLLPDGRVLIVGGSKNEWSGPGLASAELYDPRTGTFSLTGSMSVARVGHAATLLSNGCVLITGGAETMDSASSYDEDVLATAELYDPATGTFSPAGPMVMARSEHSSVLLPDGRVLIAGGAGTDEIFDPGTGTFSAISGESRLSSDTLTATLQDGRVFFVPRDFCEQDLPALYDPKTGAFGYWPPELANQAESPWNAPAWALSSACGSLSKLKDGRLLLAGGYSCVPMMGCWVKDDADVYDPKTGRFTPTGPMLSGHDRHTSTLLPDGRVLITGGGDIDACATTQGCPGADFSSAELYEPVTGEFTSAGPLNSGRIDHTATLLKDGRVLIVGGYGGGKGGAALATAELFVAAPPSARPSPTPSLGAFKLTGSLAAARSGHTATLLKDGRVLVAGGSGDSDTLASAELYNPKTGRFSPTGSMTVAREWATATLLADGRVLVGGGYDGDLALASAEVYDPKTGRFSPTGSMTIARRDCTATLLPDGRVLVAGGWVPSGDDWRILSSAEIYDPATGKFSATGGMLSIRSHHTATLLPDGRVLMAGGEGRAGTLSSTELYDPATGRFSAGGSLPAARQEHTATLLPDGRVLLAGGWSSAGVYKGDSLDVIDPGTGSGVHYESSLGDLGDLAVLPSGKVLIVAGMGMGIDYAQLFDPGTGKFLFACWLNVGRDFATVTRLADGRVLVVGGEGASDSDGAFPDLASAELYAP